MAAATTYNQDSNYFQGVNKTSCGYKLLSSMGWQEGEGLGANKQGIKTHIKVKKKLDNMGVGKVEVDSRTKEWTSGMLAYEKILTGLSEITSQRASRGAATGSDEDSDASDGGKAAQHKCSLDNAQQDAQREGKKRKRAAGSGAKGSKAGKCKQRSQGRTKQMGAAPAVAAPVAQQAGGACSSGSDSDDEGSPVRTPVRRRVSHVGRFKRREAAKAVHSYSSTDLAAIIGAVGSTPELHASTAAQQAAAQPGPVDAWAAAALGWASERAASQEAADSQNDTDSTEAKQLAPLPGQQEAAAAAVTESRWWWSSYFARAGRVGASTMQQQHRKVGFNEDDQVALYNLNKDNERCGRQGLGIKSLPPKVAGARWKGTKVRLDSDEDDWQEAAAAAQLDLMTAEQREALATRQGLGGIDAEGVVIILPTQAVQQQAAAAAGGHVAAAAPCANARTSAMSGRQASQQRRPTGRPLAKWKKVTTAVLANCKHGSMKVGKLRRKVLSQVGLEGDEARQQWLAVVSASSKFVLDTPGQLVRLATKQ